MVTRNPYMEHLKSGYLFPEVARRKKALLERNPDAKIISLGIGDTTEPLPEHIVKGLSGAAKGLGTKEGYTGYGPDQGYPVLRNKIAEKLYQSKVHPDEIFVSDGAKCDIGRLQVLFGPGATIAVQDPSYPVYVDTAVITGHASGYNPQKEHYNGITYMLCNPGNGFFPDLIQVPRTDLIYFCSPNNPTGSAANREQLADLVNFAKKNRSIIIFDSAYSAFIKDPSIPKSIYEIDGAREVAIEISSFSKLAGFTGVRLAWVIVPEELRFDDGSSVKKDWHRIMSTFFNGASNIAQMGGIAALDDIGIKEMHRIVDYYLENGKIIKKTMEQLGYKAYGSDNGPYVWVAFPGRMSWDVFEEILEKTYIITTPGSGFGPGGEGFIRFSAFGHRQMVEEAAERLTLCLQR